MGHFIYTGTSGNGVDGDYSAPTGTGGVQAVNGNYGGPTGTGSAQGVNGNFGGPTGAGNVQGVNGNYNGPTGSSPQGPAEEYGAPSANNFQVNKICVFIWYWSLEIISFY